MLSMNRCLKRYSAGGAHLRPGVARAAAGEPGALAGVALREAASAAAMAAASTPICGTHGVAGLSSRSMRGAPADGVPSTASPAGSCWSERGVPSLLTASSAAVCSCAAAAARVATVFPSCVRTSYLKICPLCVLQNISPIIGPKPSIEHCNPRNNKTASLI